MVFEMRTISTRTWCVVVLSVIVVIEVSALSGPNVCMVKQKYNITKRVKYRAPMWVRTYEWCFSMPPRCSKWNTEMKDLTRLETEERTAEVAVCCPGYKMKDVSCVPICPNGKTGPGCSEDCPDNKWGPNCIHECQRCKNGFCSPITGECDCLDGWQGESCDMSMPATTSSPLEDLLTPFPTKLEVPSTKVTTPSITTLSTTKLTTTTTTTQKVPMTIPTTTTPKSTTIVSTTSLPTSTYKLLPITTPESELTPFTSTHNAKTTAKYVNTTLASIKTFKPTTEPTTERTISQTELSGNIEPPVVIKSIQHAENHQKPTEFTAVLPVEPTREVIKKETTIKIIPTTVKFKPKEIWIKPAQKGESSITETKIKNTHEFSRHKSINHKELVPIVTTPKTIIVSIIPTSVSYTTFKKIALTLPYFSKSNTIESNKVEHEVTPPMATTTPFPTTIFRKDDNLPTAPLNTTVSNSVTSKAQTKPTSKPLEVTHRTNSMTTEINKNVSTLTVSTNIERNIEKTNEKLFTASTNSPVTTSAVKYIKEHPINSNNKSLSNIDVTNVFKNKTTITKSIKDVTNTTEQPDDEEFHILTEPEHITAVMGDKGTERTSVDLISVISIAGGVMMGVITVAVVIVMVERCKKPRYEDVRKINDIRMQVMIDNNDAPPPYVRSIFHTPLPEPPESEKCHYQPISTLDRNLKQFMRPVVVQAISPIMLENFRGILECHYDHLPRRSYDSGAIQIRSSAAPSMVDNSELHQLRASVTECAIEAFKCEARFDVIDNTTSEPLYAEIPCWRPPSEHAIEIINMNGEAVTEL